MKNSIKSKISAVVLSVMMMFGMVGNISFVNAVNAENENIILNADKTELKVNEKTKIRADVKLSDDTEIISYVWQSSDEKVAVVSGETNSADVEAKVTGKARITVTVNYRANADSEKQISKEIDINVTEAENTVPQNVVTAKKESEVEKTDDNLDPVTAEYIRKNLDTKYTSDKMMRLDQVLVVKNTLVEASGISENETIDSFFLREDAGDLFITTIPALVALYNFDENSNYYVGLANTMINDKSAEVKDQIFAINNNNAEVVNDKCHYDAKTGLVYVPKDLFGKLQVMCRYSSFRQ